jgi:hypothetical protein
MYKQVKNVLDETLPGVTVQRLSDGAFIPFDLDTPEYVVYLKWLDGYELVGRDWVKTSEGNTPLPADTE